MFEYDVTMGMQYTHDIHIMYPLCAVLWRTDEDCKNRLVLKGHRNAVLDLHWTTDGTQIVSASPDQTVRAWDAETGKQVQSPVSSAVIGLLSSPGLLALVVRWHVWFAYLNTISD